MSKSKRAVSVDKAKAKVLSAMKVVVDFMVGEDSGKESYQKRYEKVGAVDEGVIEVLRMADINGDGTAKEFYRLAKNIKAWNDNHISFFVGSPCPQRWMFKTMR